MEGSDQFRIVRDPSPTVDDAARIRGRLMAFNEACIGPANVERIALYLRDGDVDIRGGLVGYLAWRWLTIDLLWVDASLRGQGYGTALLREAEAAALAAGCVGARLDTHEFQAKPFYEHHGYAVFGVLNGYPAGSRTFHMRKDLVRVAPA